MDSNTAIAPVEIGSDRRSKSDHRIISDQDDSRHVNQHRDHRGASPHLICVNCDAHQLVKKDKNKPEALEDW